MAILYPGMSQLKIVSRPPGLEVTIDNRETGRVTPVKPFNIIPGDHELSFTFSAITKKINIVSKEGILNSINVDLITDKYTITEEPESYITYDGIVTYPVAIGYEGLAKMEEAMYGVNRQTEWTSDKALSNLIKTAEDKAKKDGLTLLHIKYNYYPGHLVHHFDIATVYTSPIKIVGSQQLASSQIIASLQIIALLTLLFWVAIVYLIYRIITAVRDIVIKYGGYIFPAILIVTVAYLIGKITPLLSKGSTKELYPEKGV